MKKFKFFASFVLTLSLLLSVFSALSPSAYAADDPQIKANAVLLVENTTGEILYSKNADGKIYPASTTKIMTALLAVEAIESGSLAKDTVVTLGDNIYQDCEGGSTAGLLVGEEISLENLVKCALVASANEACNAIAVAVSGSIDAFVARMNERAQELGCTGTHFANCHGMPNDDHYTTAHDLYLIFTEASKYTLFKDTVATASCEIPASNLSAARTLTNTDRLIQTETSDYYANCIGGKTGYTDSAGYCLVSGATDGTLSLTAVVMGSDSVLAADGTTQVESFSESKRLYEWGFSNFSFRTILSTDKLMGEVPVELGSGADSVILRPQSSVVAFLDNAVSEADITYATRIYSQEKGETIQAPVNAGDVLGEVTVSYNGKELGTVELVASTAVALSKTAYMHAEVKHTLSQSWVKLVIAGIILMFVAYAVFAILYNRRRRKMRHAARAASRRKAEEMRRRSSPTTGKSFEEIERGMPKSSPPPQPGIAPDEDVWNSKWGKDNWK